MLNVSVCTVTPGLYGVSVAPRCSPSAGQEVVGVLFYRDNIATTCNVMTFNFMRVGGVLKLLLQM